jgi:hypothetical protein
MCSVVGNSFPGLICVVLVGGFLDSRGKCCARRVRGACSEGEAFEGLFKNVARILPEKTPIEKH